MRCTAFRRESIDRPISGLVSGHTGVMARRSQERMYEVTGMTDAQRDLLIWQLRRRRVPFTRIAKRVGVSVGAVQASLRRPAAKLQPGTESADDWDADLR
jgi:hypothetical protein